MEELSVKDTDSAAGFGRFTFWLAGFAVTLAVAIGTALCFSLPPAEDFPNESLARIIVFHLPCAFGATVFLIWGTYLSLRSLLAKRIEWDVRAVAAMEICLVLCVLTMLTGILFSKTQWGDWWQWDPRQTSFLLVLLIVAAYFALRMAFADENKRAQHSAAYVVGSIVPNLFLVFVLPRIPSLGSFHPADTVIKGKFTGDYWMAILAVFAMLLALTVWLYRLRVRAGMLELALLEADNGPILDSMGGGPAPTGVVRPIAVPDAGGEKG